MYNLDFILHIFFLFWLSLSLVLFCFLFIAKVRRLYDIANVLSTINLITKVTDPSYRGPRPAFQYIGPRTEIIHHAESRIYFWWWIRKIFHFKIKMLLILSIRKIQNQIPNIRYLTILNEIFFLIVLYQDSIQEMVYSA